MRAHHFALAADGAVFFVDSSLKIVSTNMSVVPRRVRAVLAMIPGWVGRLLLRFFL
jgi:hypothetical protein